MIISGGVNIYPAEIEGELLTHPKVGDVAVFGIPHEDWGEEIKAVVEPRRRRRARRRAARAEILAFCRRPPGQVQAPEDDRLHRPSCPATPTASSTSASSATRTGRARSARSDRSRRPTCQTRPGRRHDGRVTDWDPRDRADDARRRAEQALPRAVDLWGLSWDRDDEAFDVGNAIGTSDSCLPTTFPEAARVADADVTFVRARHFGLVHAMSTVFDDALSAHQAWLQLGDDGFVSCFAESVVAAVDLDPDIELLGPLVQAIEPVKPDPAATAHPAAAGTTTRGSRRTTRARVTLSAASEAALLPDRHRRRRDPGRADRRDALGRRATRARPRTAAGPAWSSGSSARPRWRRRPEAAAGAASGRQDLRAQRGQEVRSRRWRWCSMRSKRSSTFSTHGSSSCSPEFSSRSRTQ